MIIKLARTFKASAFSALLAYVLVLNVLLAGFAHASMVQHTINGTATICTEVASVADNTAVPDQALVQHCQMCCLAAQNDNGLPPAIATVLARLGIVSAKLFPLDITGPDFTKAHFAEARGPLLS